MNIKTSWDIACQDVIVFGDDSDFMINPEIPNKRWVAVDEVKEELKKCLSLIEKKDYSNELAYYVDAIIEQLEGEK